MQNYINNNLMENEKHTKSYHKSITNDPKPLIASADVNSQSYLEMEDFLKHYGTFWYFCRR